MANPFIRGEQPGDESALDLINYLAFEASNSKKNPIADLHEADLVRFLRAYCPDYDRELSIVAWDGDRPVGHALFTPCNIRLMGDTVRALAVGPVAVIPEYQRQGIGGILLARGHEVGKQKGFALAFLLGHHTYYPRHGYVPCHGFASLTIDLGKLPAPTQQFSRKPVLPQDGPWLAELGRREWNDVDFGWLYGESLTEWHAPGMISHVWYDAEGARVAYTQANPWRKWRFVLARDAGVAQDVIATIKPESLEHHPSGWLARSLADAEWCKAEVSPSDAAMACPLQDDALAPLLAALESGRPPGCANWPIPFALIP